MGLTEKDVRHVARLAAIEISDEELEHIRAELEGVLEYVNKLSSVSTYGVVPTSHVHGVVNVFRDDIIKDSLPLEEVAKNAPDFTSSGFRVPKII